MPRVPDELTKCVGFLYPSESQAFADAAVGGIGFVVAVHQGGHRFEYVVTNRHVVLGKATWFRVPTAAVGNDLVVELPFDGWHYSAGPDVAVHRIIGPSDVDPPSLSPLILDDLNPSRARFLERAEELNIGIGDEVLMVGRFVAFDRRNLRPVLRFGNLALYPAEEFNGQESTSPVYLAEMRSYSGDSGSPVFVQLLGGDDRGNGTIMPFFSRTVGLLGVNSGHIDVRTNRGTEESSSMAIVVPFEYVHALLDRLTEVRAEELSALS